MTSQRSVHFFEIIIMITFVCPDRSRVDRSIIQF